MADQAGAEITIDSSSAAVRPAATGGVLNTLSAAVRRTPFTVLFMAAAGIVALGQVVEDLHDSQPLQMLPPEVYIPRWTVIAAVAYMLLVVKLIERPVQRSLGLVQHVVRIDPIEFRSYWLRMSTSDRRVEALLVAISAAIVFLLYPVLGRPLATTIDPVTRAPLYLPDAPVAAAAVLAGYVVLGWAGLRLVYRTIRVARALGQLSRQPLVVDPYDITDLLPFGRIALALSLGPVGLIVVLLIGLGSPQGPASWLVLSLATTASVLALVLPLRGIHRQMSAARQHALADLNRELRGLHRDLTDGAPLTTEEIGQVANRTGAIINLRKVVSEMPTWPFQGTVAFARAVLIATAPLIYTVLSELIRIFFLNPLAR